MVEKKKSIQADNDDFENIGKWHRNPSPSLSPIKTIISLNLFKSSSHKPDSNLEEMRTK